MGLLNEQSHLGFIAFASCGAVSILPNPPASYSSHPTSGRIKI
jgi:hypothetical protein